MRISQKSKQVLDWLGHVGTINWLWGLGGGAVITSVIGAVAKVEWWWLTLFGLGVALLVVAALAQRASAKPSVGGGITVFPPTVVQGPAPSALDVVNHARAQMAWRLKEYDEMRMKDRRGDDPTVTDYLEGFVADHHYMRQELKNRNVKGLSHLVTEQQTMQTLRDMQRAQFRAQLEGIVAEMDDLRKRLGG